MSRYRYIAITTLRWILGALFIFSGIVKCVDPIGTSIYIEKYMATYSLMELMPLSESFAVALSVMEFMLGVLLISGIWQKLIAFVSVIVLLLFSVVTFLSATILPIGDCGCFGDAVKLSPWATFLKNILFLFIAIILWRNSKTEPRLTLSQAIIVLLAIALPLMVNLYSLAHLPLIDFLPFKEGTNLREEVAKEQNAQRQILRFRDITTGSIVEFDASDTSCWLDSNLEFVESALLSDDAKELKYNDFYLYDSSGEDVTHTTLNMSHRIALLCINDATKLDDSALSGIGVLYDTYPESAVYIVSSTDITEHSFPADSPHLYIDAMTLRSIIRADIGVVILNDGVVEFKANIRDI